MLDAEKFNDFINKCKVIVKSHDITIIGSKDSIDRLSGFIVNAKFEIVENEFPKNDTVYIIPNNKDKPVQIECLVSEIENEIFKAIMNFKCK